MTTLTVNNIVLNTVSPGDLDLLDLLVNLTKFDHLLSKVKSHLGVDSIEELSCLVPDEESKDSIQLDDWAVGGEYYLLEPNIRTGELILGDLFLGRIGDIPVIAFQWDYTGLVFFIKSE